MQPTRSRRSRPASAASTPVAIPRSTSPGAAGGAPKPRAATDQIFAVAHERARDFDFGAETAEVFDDMLARSVPMYSEIQRMVGRLVADFAVDGSCVYDLGCSTCTSFLDIDAFLPPERDVRFVGVDSSPEMLSRARQKLEQAQFRRPFDLQLSDLNQDVRVQNASVVLLVLTLQFVRPLYRDTLLQSIHQGMNDNGCVILVEKVLGESSVLNRLFIQYYYDFKRQHGYSELEISQKREALENVLVPYRLEENRELLRRAGFRNIDVYFKWFNFCGIVAMK